MTEIPFPRAGWLGSWFLTRVKPRIVRAFVRRVTKTPQRPPVDEVPF
jgi:hypothetical protein